MKRNVMSGRTKFWLTLPILAVAFGCGDDPTRSRTTPIPAALERVGGDQQEGTAGEQLPEAIVVRVVDDRGRPIRGQLVNFRVTSGGGSVFAGAATTNAEGIAQERWTLGTKVADAQTVEARAVDSQSGTAIVFATFSATARAGPAAAVRMSPGSLRITARDDTARFAPVVTDRFGNIVENAMTTWSSLDTAIVEVDQTGLVRANTNGTTRIVARVGTAADTALVQVAQMAVSVAIAAPATSFTALGDTIPLAAVARDANGHVIPGAAVAWHSLDAAVTIDAAGRTVARSQGVARLTATLDGAADTLTLSVRQVPEFVTITPSTKTLIVGDSVRLGVVVTDRNGFAIPDVAVVWSSTVESVAVVTSGDFVRAESPGRASIRVAAGTVNQEAALDVIAFTELKSTRDHTCGLTTELAAYCWGLNFAGEIGAPASATCGNFPCNPIPARVATSLVFVTIALGAAHTCGLVADGQAYCWGQNLYGEIGDGTFDPRLAPTAVATAHRFIGLTAGVNLTCGWTSAGAVYCWGRNDEGQAGLPGGSPDRTATPVLITAPGLPAAATVDASGFRHACLLSASGEAWCWGDNLGGKLGSSGPSTHTPQRVSASTAFAAIDVGGSHTCALSPAGAAYCWGGNLSGQLGDGTTVSRSVPAPVAGDRVYSRLAVGGSHSCAVAESSTGARAYCWGSNGKGQLGRDIAGGSPSPVAVLGDHDFRVPAAGSLHSCALDRRGAPYCWGDNAWGHLGRGTGEAASPVPGRVRSP